ncbi:MAG: uracil-DNA glycosylase [Rhodospirillaceae bacterium]|nr:uracil-DNA glycosylase [Rhodospirillaceae bacterium]|tara:strand:- start:276 stop:914 length:639 start_codon:yes stop_codon:yes gene_type:complete
MTDTFPGRDCSLCPRLVGFREDNRASWPDWHNAPVDSFGSLDATLLIVGLAPGLRGANRTSRPFTGDYAGQLLYPTLLHFGLAIGDYAEDPEDSLLLVNCRITNAVRCVPPQNKPIGAEINTCRDYLTTEITSMPNLSVILALGTVSHASILRSEGLRQKDWKFGHGAFHELPSGVTLANSYHCSRYNTNTGRLTKTMFHDVFVGIVNRVRA